MTDATASASPTPVAEIPFPPASLKDFLALCDGRWMSLRSTFALDGSEDWHNSERGEVAMRHQSDATGAEALEVTDDKGRTLSALSFAVDGGLKREGVGAMAAASGHWQLRDDGSLELNVPASEGALVLERIWFIKPNLRLRSTTLVDSHGIPQQASFCSEIRRVSAPSR